MKSTLTHHSNSPRSSSNNVSTAASSSSPNNKHAISQNNKKSFQSKKQLRWWFLLSASVSSVFYIVGTWQLTSSSNSSRSNDKLSSFDNCAHLPNMWSHRKQDFSFLCQDPAVSFLTVMDPLPLRDTFNNNDGQVDSINIGANASNHINSTNNNNNMANTSSIRNDHERESKQQIYRPKILCIVLTQGKSHKTRLQAILDTWGRKCDKLIAASDQDDPIRFAQKIEPTIPNITRSGGGDGGGNANNATTDLVAGYWDIYDKLLQTFRKVVHDKTIRAENYDWILKADDDTYFIMENLWSFLANVTAAAETESQVDISPSNNNNKNKNIPMVFGRTIPWPRLQRFRAMQGWFSDKMNQEFGKRFYKRFTPEQTLRFSHGGPGYIMNWEYIELLVHAYFDTMDAIHGRVAEDIASALTMLYHNVTPTSTIDVETGRERMHPESPQSMYANPIWLSKMHHGIQHSLGDGENCCSPTSISYHYVADFQMRLLDYQLYQCPKQLQHLQQQQQPNGRMIKKKR